MAFVKKTWKDRISQYPNRRSITDSNGIVKTVTVGRDEGTVTQAGDAFNAQNMNDLENRIANAIAGGGGGGSSWIDITDTLEAGETSITFTDETITTSSTLDVYTDVFGVNPTNMSVETGSVTLTFEEQETDLGVKVRIS